MITFAFISVVACAAAYWFYRIRKGKDGINFVRVIKIHNDDGSNGFYYKIRGYNGIYFDKVLSDNEPIITKYMFFDTVRINARNSKIFRLGFKPIYRFYN